VVAFTAAVEILAAVDGDRATRVCSLLDDIDDAGDSVRAILRSGAVKQDLDVIN
jgi:hypothetical protein